MIKCRLCTLGRNINEMVIALIYLPVKYIRKHVMLIFPVLVLIPIMSLMWNHKVVSSRFLHYEVTKFPCVINW